MSYHLQEVLSVAARQPSSVWEPFASKDEAGMVELNIADLQPIQEYVRGGFLLALARQNGQFPIVALENPNGQDRLLIAEGHHRTYLRQILGFTTVHARLITNEEQYAQMVATGDEPTLERNGPTLADFCQMYEADCKPLMLQKGIRHISHLNVI